MFQKATQLASKKIPFLIYTDFLATKVHVIELDKLSYHDIEFELNRPNKIYYTLKRQRGDNSNNSKRNSLVKRPIPLSKYKKSFDTIIEEIKCGNTYLLNLTFSTPIQTQLSLQEVFKNSTARFKLRVKNEFLCCSPEQFIQIQGNKISTFPMKGTINALTPNAETTILNDKKELAEHTMVVDLLRNDLGIVSSHVKVEKFRFVERINAGQNDLLQVSSKITAQLPNNWHNNFGTILQQLLPAGSITGTPKKSTVSIIQDVEHHDRNYFCGVFDGENFDSAVMIRFIENQRKNNQDHFIYKSGGGITLDSDLEREYQEMIDKVYI